MSDRTRDHAPRRAARVYELAVADVDADVRNRFTVATAREGQEIARLQPRWILDHRRAQRRLLTSRARRVQVERGEHVAHEPTAVEATIRVIPAEHVFGANLCLGKCDDG